MSRIFGPKMEKGTRVWNELHNEELQNFYSSPNIIRVIRLRRMRLTRGRRSPYKFLVGTLEGKIQFRRPMRRWEDNIKKDLKAVVLENVNCINLVEDRA
jgi:hypothetical protein